MIEKDADGNPIRPLYLTPEQLRRAYQVPPIDNFFAECARMRLAMLRKEQKRELHLVREDNDVG